MQMQVNLDKMIKSSIRVFIMFCFVVFTFLVGTNSVFAQTSENDASPTLDALNAEGVINPATGTVYPLSAYTITKVDSPNDYTITKYIWNVKTQGLDTEYYEVGLKRLNYGETTTTNIQTKNYLVNVTKNGEVTITYKYDIPSSDSYVSRVENLSSGYPIMGDVTGNFKDYSANHAIGGSLVGGAVTNRGSIGDIKGYFIGNYSSTYNRSAAGGAIYNMNQYVSSYYDFSNYSAIGDIEGHFIGNYTFSTSTAVAGAIYNYFGTIGHIKADFIENYVQSTYSTVSDGYGYGGGAIYNGVGTIGDITGDFVGNYGLYDILLVAGGAIYNGYQIGDLKSNFIENYVKSTSYRAYGGAVANVGVKIGDILGSFIGNYAEGYTDASGGAIYSISEITYITGDFIDNYTISHNGRGYGGAIYNYDDIGAIAGDFIDNSVLTYGEGQDGKAGGGAIYSGQYIGTLTGSFANNYVNSVNGLAQGGAIYNVGNITALKGNFIANYAKAKLEADGGAIVTGGGAVITSIEGDFLGNYVISETTSAAGGAILNSATITSLEGDFVENYVIGETLASGGAIYDGGGNIDNIVGDFVGNYVSASDLAQGGAITNKGNMGNLESQFVDNTATAISDTSEAYGAVIYNLGTVGNITGDFFENTVTANAKSYGGAIYSKGADASIGNISGLFLENWVLSGTDAKGGAIYNEEGTIGDISGDFMLNMVSASDENSSAMGGAIYNTGKMGTLDSTFDFNMVTASSIARGGAIYNSGEMGAITGDFTYNSLTAEDEASGGAIYNEGTIGDINGDFNSNTVSTSGIVNGGAIYNSGTMSNMTSTFKNTYTTSGSSVSGGVIYNSGTMGDMTCDFSGTYAISEGTANGGVIYNSGSMGDMKSNFNKTYAIGVDDVSGGVIYNSGSIGKKSEDGTVTGGIINTSFIGNYAESSNGTARGGAIYTSSDLRLIADNKIIQFNKNYTLSGSTKQDNAIYVGSPNATFSFDLRNGAKVIMRDSISGSYVPVTDVDNPDAVISTVSTSVTGATAEVTGDDGKISYQSKYKSYGVDIKGDSVSNTQFYMPNDMYMADLSVGGTTINVINNKVHVYPVNNFTLTGDTHFIADVDLSNQTMDRIISNGYGQHQGRLSVVGMNVIADGPANLNKIEIYFAEPGLKDYVDKGFSGDLPYSKYQTVAYSPIYKYHVDYENRDDAGYFVFSRGGGNGGRSSNPSEDFNPAVLNASVAAQAGAQVAMNETFHYVFEHADAFSKLPERERLMMLEPNTTAVANADYGVTNPDFGVASTDYNNNMLYNCNEPLNKGMWIRPYTSFENVHLLNGPRADIINYGILAGYDTVFHKMKHGWTNIGTGYLGYNGSVITYKGTSTTMNGGVLGLTETFYRKNFWTAVTAAAGASVGEANNMYGKEDFTNFVAGIASKTGYNFEFKHGKYILQPVWLMSYTFVNTFDYRNSANVKIKSDPMHTIQLNPSINFIATLKHGWKPYLSVGMVWDLINRTYFTANNVKLPEMHIKPYVEYGLGIQRVWKDKYTAFGQAMLRNGGRNGIALTFGFRWTVGKDKRLEELKANQPMIQEDIPK